MAKAAPVTRAGGGQGEGKKIGGVNRTTALVVGGAALGLGLLYFYFKGKQQPQQGQDQGKAPGSPTGLTREQFVIWTQDHGRHHKHPKK
jgi:hypothetical protein